MELFVSTLKFIADSAADVLPVGVFLSGGLDSTHALIVSVQAMEWLGLPHENVLAYTMPGYATSWR